MRSSLATAWFGWLGGQPAFRIHAKGRPEHDWRVIDVLASDRRDLASRWPRPFWPGTCIAWTAAVIAVGWDFAESVLCEQRIAPASRAHPVEVPGGRIHAASRPGSPTASEVLAHECGHTWQAVRLGWLYWPVGAAFTLFREGPRWYNYFENQASEEGLFGGIVNGSVCQELMSHLRAC